MGTKQSYVIAEEIMEDDKGEKQCCMYLTILNTPVVKERRHLGRFGAKYFLRDEKGLERYLMQVCARELDGKKIGVDMSCVTVTSRAHSYLLKLETVFTAPSGYIDEVKLIRVLADLGLDSEGLSVWEINSNTTAESFMLDVIGFFADACEAARKKKPGSKISRNDG